MVTRENQAGLLRDSNDTGASFNELASEDFLTAYRIERERIRREREAEIEREQKDNQGKTFPESLQEQIKDLLGDAIEDKIRDRFPKSVDALVTVIEEAQNNQLKVQDAIAPQIKTDDCGVSIESLFINYTYIEDNCRRQEGTSTGNAPYIPPQTRNFPAPDIGSWQEFVNPGNFNKLFTFTANYSGWCFFTYFNFGQEVQINTANPPPVGTVITGIKTFQPALARFETSFTFGGVTYFSGIAVDDGLKAGSLADVPIPSGSDRFSFSDRSQENRSHPSGFTRSNYYPVAVYLGSTRFNTPTGVQWFHNIKINFRWDITINNVIGAWSAMWNVGNKPNHRISAFFEGVKPYAHYDAMNPLVSPVKISGNPTKPALKKPEPPPPPPRSKCDCMANCCPQNQYDLAEVKRLLRAISAKQREQDRKIGLDKLPLEVPGSNAVYQKLGKMAADNPVTNFFFNNWLTQQVLSVTGIFPNVKLNSLLEAISFLSSEGGGGGDSSDLAEVVGQPIEVSLWDTDFTKQGSQVEKRKPKNLFQHLALLTDRVEVALKIIGIHDLPIVVDKSRSKYDNLAKVFIASPSTAMVEMGKSLLKVDRKQITSVFQLLNWVGDTVDEKLGHWESEVSFKDVDLLKHNNQEMNLVHGNMQHALHDITKFSGNAGIHAEANTWLLSDVLMEMAVLKKTIIEQTYTLQALVDYLGFDHGEEAVDIPIPVTFDQKLLEEKNLPKFLEDSTTPGLKITLKDKEKSLSQRLTEIENTLGILRAVNLFPVKGVADIKALLELLNNEKRWEATIKSANKFSEENELQLEIKKNDDPTE